MNSGLDFVQFLRKEDQDNKKEKEVSISTEIIVRKLTDSLSRTSTSTSDLHEDIIHQPKIEEETKAMGSVKSDVYWNYIKADAGIMLFSATVIATVVSQTLMQYGDYFLSQWTNKESCLAQTSNDTLHDCSFTKADQQYNVKIYSVIIFCLFLSTMVRATVFFAMCMNASVNLHNKIFNTILRAPMTMFDNNPVGRILNRFLRDLGIVDESLPATSFDLNLTMFNAFGICVVVAIVNPYLIIPAIALVCVVIFVRGVYIKTARDVKRFEGMTRSPVYSHVSNTINGLATIRAFKVQKPFEEQFYRYLNDHSGTWYLFICSSRALGVVMDWICLGYIIAVTTVLMAFPHDIPGGDAGLIMSSALMLIGMFQWGIRQSAEFEAQMTAVERVLEYSKLESEASLVGEKPPPEGWPSKGEILYSNVCFAYAQNAKPVLGDLTFKIKGGEKVGIVGRTGAGKSSLLQSLFRMVEPEGNIIIDGIDTKTLGLHELRQKISIIPQDPILFIGTVRHNIDPFKTKPDEDLWRVLEEVQLKNVIHELEGQLEAHISEGGSNFSVGQRQLICLATAILRDNKILVLDEATANVDHETDALIQSTIREKFANCTVLTIAHRLNTIIDSDRVMVLDAGMLTEFDEPHLLLQQPLGFFRKLVKQTGHQISRHLFAIAESVYERKHQASLKSD